MEKYLEEIADALAGKYVVTEDPNGKSLVVTPVNGTAETKNITYENNKFSVNGKSYDSIDELINSFGKIEESIVQDSFKEKGIEVAPGNKGNITNSGLSEAKDPPMSEIAEKIENCTNIEEVFKILKEWGSALNVEFNKVDEDNFDIDISYLPSDAKYDDSFEEYLTTVSYTLDDVSDYIDSLDDLSDLEYEIISEEKECNLTEDTKNFNGFTILLKYARFRSDELQDMNDLWDLTDEIGGESIEDIMNGGPDDLTEEEAQILYDYVGTMSDEDRNRIWDEVHGFDLGESKELKEDVELEDVLELLLPDSNEGVTTEEPVEPVEIEVEVQDVPGNQSLLELAKYLISAGISIKYLHHNLVGGNWFSNHERLGDYYNYINQFEDEVIEQAIMLGSQEPSVEEALQAYPALNVQPRDKQETFSQLKIIFDTIVSMVEGSKDGLPADVISKFEEYQNYLRKEADYKVVRDLQENYVLVSNKDIKKRLVLESKLDEVKKDAEQECIKRGCDTYVYQLGEDIFFAEEKPTDTRLINKGILTLGKYRIGVSEGKPVDTWFEESKSASSNKKSLKDLAESLQDDKTFEDPHESEAEKDIVSKANYNKKNANQEIGRTLNDIPHEEFNGGENPEENEKAANYNKKNANQEIGNTVDDKPVSGSFEGTATREIISKATYNKKDANQELNRNVTKVPGRGDKVTEGKEPEVEEDNDQISLAAYKSKYKKEIDDCYKCTYGEDIDKDLYNSLAEFMYSQSITGEVNTRKDYKSMNDKIKETEIAGHKIEIIDNAPDGHEENQPK